jgi:hypothetical protein
MNCVFWAYQDYLEWLNIPEREWEPAYWAVLKQLANGDALAPTKGSVAPWLIKQLARLHGLEITVQSKVKTKAVHLNEAGSAIERWVVRRSDYGALGEITLTPAIVMNSKTRHAWFSTSHGYVFEEGWGTVELSPWVTMAIQLRRKHG